LNEKQQRYTSDHDTLGDDVDKKTYRPKTTDRAFIVALFTRLIPGIVKSWLRLAGADAQNVDGVVVTRLTLGISGAPASVTLNATVLQFTFWKEE
jgi:hypothetical protein